jgi:hypothetical protein
MDVSEGVNFLLSSISLQMTSRSGTPFLSWFLSWLLSRLTSNKPGTACLRQRKRDCDPLTPPGVFPCPLPSGSSYVSASYALLGQ